MNPLKHLRSFGRTTKALGETFISHLCERIQREESDLTVTVTAGSENHNCATFFYLNPEVKLVQEMRLKESSSNHTWLRSRFTANNGKHSAHLRFTLRVCALCAESGLMEACWDPTRVSFCSESHKNTSEARILVKPAVSWRQLWED